ncbi:helix-turn-helix transcriptional regulator [Thermoflexus sp.]|uniref:helix-turn-helix transcriptional regulator n=1 Tax=Thermoflexus sp. TaxID=1969742 RepID=UPI001751A30B|nr:helix-turn-helix domain-containing protein [Thermoflexus sp.]
MSDTRTRILQILREKGEATAIELATQLDLRAVTIRHHLRALRADGLIREVRTLRNGRGRPRIVFTLTEAANRLFPRNYEGLVRHLLPLTMSPDKIRQVACRMSQEAHLHGRIGRDRLSAAIAFLNEKGYLARLEASGDRPIWVEIRNCPYLEVAREREELCALDAALMEELFGAPAERVSCIVHGDPACRYRIRSEAA